MPLQFDTFRRPMAFMPLLEFALIAGLAIQGVRLLWAIITPVGALGLPAQISLPQAKADFTVLSRFDPFFRGLDGSGTARSSAASGAYALFGVRVGGRGSAILAGPDGTQGSYLVGETVAPGLVLTSVGADHAILSRAGARTRIVFATPSSSSFSSPLAPPLSADAGSGTIVPKVFLSQNTFQPRVEKGQVLGYSVAPRDSGQSLQQAGLQAGDVIRTINGSALSRNRFEEIESEFSGASQVKLTVERDGQVITKNLRVTQ